MILIRKLYDELTAAAIPFSGLIPVNLQPNGVADSVTINFLPEATPEQQAQAAAIVAAHDPVDYEAIQVAEGRVTAGTYQDGLDALNMRSKLFCIVYRRLADKYGETPTITTRAEANAWNNANTDFQAFSAEQRQYLRRFADALCEAMTTVLRG